MENYEIVLLNDSQGAVLKAKNIRLDFQSSLAAVGQFVGNMSDVNITVSAEQESVLRNGSVVTGKMKQVAIRGVELEAILATMDYNAESIKLTAKLEIWKTFNTAIQEALTIALKEQYQLDTPVIY